MTFADDLNKQVEEHNKMNQNIPDEEKLISGVIEGYTKSIKELCVKQAKKGKTTLKGFFIPEISNYAYTLDPEIVDKPQSYAAVKPTIDEDCNLHGGAADLVKAVICSGEDDASKVDKILNGILNNLSKDGFKSLSVLHVTGPHYDRHKGLFGFRVIEDGICHYLYLDIEW